MKTNRVFLSAICVFFLASCTGMNDTQQRTLSGAAIGGAAGLGVGILTGGALGWGALGGAAVGAAGGYVYDRYETDKQNDKHKK